MCVFIYQGNEPLLGLRWLPLISEGSNIKKLVCEYRSGRDEFSFDILAKENIIR